MDRPLPKGCGQHSIRRRESQFHLLTCLLEPRASATVWLKLEQTPRQFATAATLGHSAGALPTPPVGRRLPTPLLFTFLSARATGGQTTGVHTDTANVASYFSYVIANYVVTLIL